jgi:hypothetical protein
MAKEKKEEMAEEAVVEAVAIQEVVPETPEQAAARLQREDYQRRNLAAMDEYEKITGLPHPSRQSPDAAVNQRCCF